MLVLRSEKDFDSEIICTIHSSSRFARDLELAPEMRLTFSPSNSEYIWDPVQPKVYRLLCIGRPIVSRDPDPRITR
jgi:hypothetical protein